MPVKGTAMLFILTREAQPKHPGVGSLTWPRTRQGVWGRSERNLALTGCWGRS